MDSRSATDNAKALDAFMTAKFQIDAMLERLKALSDDHFDPFYASTRWKKTCGHADALSIA